MDDLMDFQISTALFTNGKKTSPKTRNFLLKPRRKKHVCFSVYYSSAVIRRPNLQELLWQIFSLSGKDSYNTPVLKKPTLLISALTYAALHVTAKEIYKKLLYIPTHTARGKGLSCSEDTRDLWQQNQATVT